MGGIPVHIVTGASGSGKSALIARLAWARRDRLGLVNILPVDPSVNLKALSAGCPCCTGRIVLQVSLVRALRDNGATRAFVEIADRGHAATLETLLDEPPLRLSVVAARRIFLPPDAGISASELDA